MSNDQKAKIESLEADLNQSQANVMLLQQAMQALASLEQENKK